MSDQPAIRFVCRNFRIGPPLPRNRKRRRKAMRHRMMRLKRWFADFNEVTTETWTDTDTGLPILRTIHRNPVTWERSERIEVVAGCGIGQGLKLLSAPKMDTNTQQPSSPEQPEASEGLAASAGGMPAASGAGIGMKS